MGANWAKLRLDYIHGNMSLRELAEQNNIKSAGVMRRAANEGWEASRKQESANVSRLATASLTDTRATELAKFNDDDLRVARAIRAKAANLLSTVTSPQDIRALASAFDTAQKIGRLALGAATENTSVTTRTLDPLKDEDFLG